MQSVCGDIIPKLNSNSLILSGPLIIWCDRVELAKLPIGALTVTDHGYSSPIVFYPILRWLNNLVSWLNPQHLDSLATKVPNNLSFITA